MLRKAMGLSRVLSVLVFIGIASSALADSIGLVTMTVPGINGSPGNGGPYQATVNGTGPTGTGSSALGMYSPGQSFLTFCIEEGEFFNPGTQYAGVISDRAVFGNNGTNSGGSDPLNSQTAFLYSHYMAGDLSTLVAGFNANSLNNLQSLQKAIWKFEGESTALDAMGTSLYNAAQSLANGTTYNVAVLQLWDKGPSGNLFQYV